MNKNAGKFVFPMSPYCKTMCAGKQASLMMGPVDLPFMNHEPKDVGKQASLMIGPVDLPSMNHEPMNHVNCTHEQMNNATTEHKLAVRHARNFLTAWIQLHLNTTSMNTMTNK